MKLKNTWSNILVYTNIIILFIDIMLIAELNKCYLLYSISLNILLINNVILKRYAKTSFLKSFIKE